MKKKLFLIALTFGLGLYAADSSAQIFKLTITDYGGINDPTLRSFIDSEILRIQNDVNKNLPSAPPQRLMEGMANSSVMAGKGIGTDYASNMDVLLIGGGVGLGADLKKDSNTDSDISGIGIAPGMIIGANLGFLDAKRFLGMDTDRLNLYLNFMKYGLDRELGDKQGKESSVELDMLAMGIHFRYDGIKGKGTKLLGWGGVKFHFGYEYNKTNITFNSNIKETVEASSGVQELDGIITGSPSAEIAVNTHSLPLALSTDIQLLYLLSLYGGLGVDVNFGQAKGNGALNAPESTVTCTNGLCGAGTNVQVKPEANIDGTGKAASFLSRGFVGLQLNLPYIRIFGQVDKAFGNDLVGATAGVRFVY